MRRAGLTPRQSDVAREVATGASNKEIAYRLGLDDGTVKVYISTILRRLALDNRVQLALWTVQHRYE